MLVALEMYLPRGAFEAESAVFVFLLYVLQTGLTILCGLGGGAALWRRVKAGRATAE